MIDLNKVMNELRYRKTFLLAHDLQKNINFEVDISHIDSIFESNAYESENIITKVENFCINLLLKIKFDPSKLDFFNKENNLKIFFGNTEYREKEMKMAKIKLAGKKKT